MRQFAHFLNFISPPVANRSSTITTGCPGLNDSFWTSNTSYRKEKEHNVCIKYKTFLEWSMQMPGSMCKYRLKLILLEKILKIHYMYLGIISPGLKSYFIWTNFYTIQASIFLKFALWILTKDFENWTIFDIFIISQFPSCRNKGVAVHLKFAQWCFVHSFILSIYFHYFLIISNCRRGAWSFIRMNFV